MRIMCTKLKLRIGLPEWKDKCQVVGQRELTGQKDLTFHNSVIELDCRELKNGKNLTDTGSDVSLVRE